MIWKKPLQGKYTPSFQMKDLISQVIGKFMNNFGEFLAFLLILYPLSFSACSFY